MTGVFRERVGVGKWVENFSPETITLQGFDTCLGQNPLSESLKLLPELVLKAIAQTAA